MVQVKTILQRRASLRAAQRERLRQQTRAQLLVALRELIPGRPVRVFGSLAMPGRFHERSDIDLALESEPTTITRFGLIGELEERLGRPVDVVLLDQCRFKQKILRNGHNLSRLSNVIEQMCKRIAAAFENQVVDDGGCHAELIRCGS